jgi:hypothetical protein
MPRGWTLLGQTFLASSLLMHRPREAPVDLEHREHPRAQHGAIGAV